MTSSLPNLDNTLAETEDLDTEWDLTYLWCRGIIEEIYESDSGGIELARVCSVFEPGSEWEGRIVGLSAWTSLGRGQRGDPCTKGWMTFRKRMSKVLNRWWDEEHTVKREELLAQALPKFSELDTVHNLEILGVIPEFRERGIGKRLVDEVAGGFGRKSVYVEATSEANADMYQRWGFKLKAEGHFESELCNFDIWSLYKEI